MLPIWAMFCDERGKPEEYDADFLAASAENFIERKAECAA